MDADYELAVKTSDTIGINHLDGQRADNGYKLDHIQCDTDGRPCAFNPLMQANTQI